MANKRITELEEVTELVGDEYLPVDGGNGTHKLSVDDFITKPIEGKQDTEDETLETDSKEIVGAINELVGDISTVNTDLSDKQPYMDYVIIQTTTTGMSANTAIAIESGNSNVIGGTTNVRPSTDGYIPVIVNATDSANHQTTVHFIGSVSKWYIRSTVVQKYTIVFYKVPFKS